jgi:hypothetical protein
MFVIFTIANDRLSYKLIFSLHSTTCCTKKDITNVEVNMKL